MSSTPTYTSFAVVGAGDIGLDIVKALVARKVSVLVVTRPSSSPKDLPVSVKTVAVDHSDKAALVAAFKAHKVEVIIGAAGPPGYASQVAVAEAGVEAGAKLFVPSEYGMPTAGRKDGLFKVKDDVANKIVSLGLPTARMYVGYFAEYLPWLAGVESGTAYVIGTGKTATTWTTKEDISGFMAYVLTSLPESQLANATFRIQSERKSMLDALALYQGKYPIEHVDTVPETLTSWNFRTCLQQNMEGGRSSTGYNAVTEEDEGTAGSSNSLWVGHEWKTIKEALNL